jgi:thioredoxin reductase
LRIISIPDEYKDFKGTVVHTGAWDSTVDFKDKRVAVIGNGARYVVGSNAMTILTGR